MAQIAENITEVVGRTPLVRLNRLPEGTGATVLAKLEFYNPAASVKDRIGVAIIDAAEKSGELVPGGTIVEGTSGNTGIALALVGAARGYKIVLTMPETASVERRVVLRAFGAEVVLTPGAEGMKGAVATRRPRSSRTRPGRSSPGSSRTRPTPRSTAPPPAPRSGPTPTARSTILVAGIGTGGTITGAGGFLKERKPDVKVVAVEPADSPILTGGNPGPHKIQGIGANFVPDVLDRDVYDEVIDVGTPDAIATARRLASDEGILGGISSGAAVWAALEVARRPENSGKTIVVVVPDFGERYLSTVLYEDLRD